MKNKRRLPSCRKASSGKALSGQPILANSVTYHWFRVSFQVALDTTTKAGQSETTQPIQSIQPFPFVSLTGTSTAFMSSPFGSRRVTGVVYAKLRGARQLL